MNDTQHWCKYHVVFAPMCRRKVFYEEVGAILGNGRGGEYTTYVARDAAKNECIGFCGVFKKGRVVC